MNVRNKKAQTATEYIVIVAVVIVIALVLVQVMGGFPGIGSGTSKKVSDYKLASTGEIGVDKYFFTNDSVVANLKNNNFETLIVDNITIAGVNCTNTNPVLPLTINPGQSILFNCTDYNFDSSQNNGATPIVLITYTNPLTGASYSTSSGGAGSTTLASETILNNSETPFEIENDTYTFRMTSDNATLVFGAINIVVVSIPGGITWDYFGVANNITDANPHVYEINDINYTISFLGIGSRIFSVALGGTNGTLITRTFYQVTYFGNNNTNGSVPIDSNNYSSRSIVTVKNNSGSLVRTSFTFVGWNTLANGSGTDYAMGSNLVINSSNVSLYAQWTLNPTYTVTYNANNFTNYTNYTGSAPNDTNHYENGMLVTILDSGSLNKTGYSFVGWNTLSNGTGINYSIGSNFTMNSSNVILYAQWVANNNTITFNINGGIAGTMSAQTIATDSSANLYSNNFTRTGYSFAGWANTSNGVVAYANGASFTMGSSNVNLYANWTANNYSITWNSATGGTSSGAAICVYGTTVTPTCTNNTGYSVSSCANFICNLTNSFTPIFSANSYTLTINPTLGSVFGTCSVTCSRPYNTSVSLSAGAATGYTFNGWSGGSCSGTGTCSFTMGTGNTVTANYLINSYTITFNSNGGTSVNSITQNFNTSISAPTPPTRVGYTFANWSPSLPSYMPAGGLTTTAQWNVIPENCATPGDEDGDGQGQCGDSDCFTFNYCIVTSLRQGLLAYYPLDGNFSDMSGNGYTPTYSGVSSTSGRVGSAYSFNGVDNSMHTPGSLTFNENNDFSLSAWFNSRAWSSGGCGPNQIFTHDGLPGLLIGNDWMGFTLQVDNTTGGAVRTGTTLPPINSWHNVVVVRESNVFKLYLDGVLANSLSSAGYTYPIYTSLTIGGSYCGTVGNFFNGTIDEIGIWNRALLSTDVSNLYNSTYGRSLVQ